MKRTIILYLATLIVMVPIDFLFLGVIAKSLFQNEVGDMLGDLRITPAVLFYLLYPIGIVIFASASAGTNWQSALLYGALFGLFCYSTFELTNMAMLKHWSWTIVVVDIGWGAFVTGLSAALGLLITNWIAAKI